MTLGFAFPILYILWRILTVTPDKFHKPDTSSRPLYTLTLWRIIVFLAICYNFFPLVHHLLDIYRYKSEDRPPSVACGHDHLLPSWTPLNSSQHFLHAALGADLFHHLFNTSVVLNYINSSFLYFGCLLVPG